LVRMGLTMGMMLVAFEVWDDEGSFEILSEDFVFQVVQMCFVWLEGVLGEKL